MGPAFVENLPVGKFHGVGPATAAKMNSLGIHTGLDLRRQSSAFLSERVLEDVRGLRRPAADKQEAGVREPIERRAKLRLRQIGDGRQQLVAELAADRRTPLRDILRGWSQPIQPRHQRGVQGRGHGQCRMLHRR